MELNASQIERNQWNHFAATHNPQVASSERLLHKLSKHLKDRKLHKQTNKQIDKQMDFESKSVFV